MKTSDVETLLANLRIVEADPTLAPRIERDLREAAARRPFATFGLAAALVVSIGMNIYQFTRSPVVTVEMPPPVIEPPTHAVTVVPTPGDFGPEPVIVRN